MIQPRINQKIIAKQLNLSPATVSKSLRNHPDISQETRARVVEHASRLGYNPELTSWGVRFPAPPVEGRFVGVLIHDNHGPSFADVSGQGYVTGLSEAAAANDVSLVVHRFSGESRKILDPGQQPPAMRQGNLAGLVLVHRYEPEVVRVLAQQWPCVTLTFYTPGARCDHVDSNYIGAMEDVVEHLRGLGHERIGYVGHPNRPGNSFARFGAFAQAMARSGLQLDLANVINVYDGPADWDEQGERVYSRLKGNGVTGWVCSVDTVGYQLCKNLGGRGVRIPEDISVTGYDFDEAMFGLAKLTTVRVPFEGMGEVALSRLLARVDRPMMASTQTFLDCELVQGRTTGAVQRE